jgi:hypothetical protein
MDLAVRQYVRTQTATMYEPAKNARPGQAFEVGARLASALAEALDLSHPETFADKAVQLDASHHQVPSGFGGWDLHAARRQLFERLGFHQGKVIATAVWVRESAGAALVAVSPQTSALQCFGRRYYPHWAFGLGGKGDRLDHARPVGLAADTDLARGIMLGQDERGD